MEYYNNIRLVKWSITWTSDVEYSNNIRLVKWSITWTSDVEFCDNIVLVKWSIATQFSLSQQDVGVVNMSEMVSAVASKVTSAVLGKISQAG